MKRGKFIHGFLEINSKHLILNVLRC
uniref:Uncharacterized protein n=1 Tax=Arundo donax TaxID=35708 RepID=A0A0A9BV00_ARUDO